MLCSRAHRRRNTSMPKPTPPKALTSDRSRTTIWASACEVTTSRNLCADSLCTSLPSHSTTAISPMFSTATFNINSFLAWFRTSIIPPTLEHGQYHSFALYTLGHGFRVRAGIPRRNEHIWPMEKEKSPLHRYTGDPIFQGTLASAPVCATDLIKA